MKMRKTYGTQDLMERVELLSAAARTNDAARAAWLELEIAIVQIDAQYKLALVKQRKWEAMHQDGIAW